MDPKIFANPPKQFRASPFWSWNDDLQPDELRRQVREFKDKGFGGYFMHSRMGLATEYLSERWFECVDATIDEGKKQDLESWLYDEDRWPSGFAGGIVPAMDRDFIIKHISCDPVGVEPSHGDDPEAIAVFEIDLDDNGRIVEARPITRPFPTENPDGRLWAFNVQFMKRSDRYNGEAYVDLLNPEVTQAFIECTYKPYVARYGDDIPRHVPGIFTDEPNYRRVGVGIPWTGELKEYFRERNGYDITEKLPLLFFDGANDAKVRYDFWRTATERFIEAYDKPLYDYCAEVGLDFTGHYLSEDTLIKQVTVIGAAMPHYEYMQVPGIDHLSRSIGNPLTRKQVQSAANQLGRRRVLCEIFGISGQDMSFEDQKWIADAHFAMGVNFMCQHLTLYSMPGDRKRDYPPTFSYHQPYWPHYGLMNDYMARCSYATRQGDPVCDVLVLHPIASAWSTYRADMETEIERPPMGAVEYDKALGLLVDNLFEAQRDFNLGDEIMMARHATVQDGALVIGAMRYQVVIMPHSLNWSADTIDLIQRFVAGGGQLVLLGEPPKLIDGVKGHEYRKLFNTEHADTAENTPASLRKTLDALSPRDVRVTDPEGREIATLLYNHLRDGDEDIYFLCNTSRVEGGPVTVSLNATGCVTEFDPTDGSTRTVPVETRDGRTLIQTSLPPVGSRIFVVNTRETPEHGAPAEAPVVERRALADAWMHKRMHANSLTLDTATYAVDDEDAGERMPVWKIRRALGRRFDTMQYSLCQPWVLRKEGIEVPGDHTVTLQMDFSVKELPQTLALVIEHAEQWTVTVNGHAVDTRSPGWHWDKQFGKVDILPATVLGHNRIVMKTTYRVETEIEDVYLVGDFGVYPEDDGAWHIAGEPGELRTGDWCEQGYPFYAGNMLYGCQVEATPEDNRRYAVRLDTPSGTLFRVSVNGGEPTAVCWQPWEVDITEALRPGTNRVAIEVCGSLRNTFGPLHQADILERTGVSPGSFTDEAHWTDDYLVVPSGLLGGAELIVREA